MDRKYLEFNIIKQMADKFGLTIDWDNTDVDTGQLGFEDEDEEKILMFLSELESLLEGWNNEEFH